VVTLSSLRIFLLLEKARIKASFDIRHYKLKGKNIDLTNHKHFVPILQAAYLNITAQTAPQIIKKTPLKWQRDMSKYN